MTPLQNPREVEWTNRVYSEFARGRIASSDFAEMGACSPAQMELRVAWTACAPADPSRTVHCFERDERAGNRAVSACKERTEQRAASLIIPRHGRVRSLHAVTNQTSFDQKYGVLSDRGHDVGEAFDALADGEQLQRRA